MAMKKCIALRLGESRDSTHVVYCHSRNSIAESRDRFVKSPDSIAEHGESVANLKIVL
jgi:hypothetical protein